MSDLQEIETASNRSNADFFDDPISVPKSIFQTKFYRELVIARSLDDFLTRVKIFLLDLDFTHYGLMRVEGKVPSLKASSYEEPPLHIISSPHQMTEIYFEKKLYGLDMVLDIVRNNNGPFFQSMIKDFVTNTPFITEKITKNREICKLYKNFGYDDFYYVPLGEHIDNSNGRVMLYVGVENKDVIDFKAHIRGCKHMLRDLAEAVNYIGTRKFPDSFLFVRKSRAIKITPRPLLVLEALASDLTLIQVAEKLGISTHTADKHSAAAKKAFNANTIHGAIYKARKLGFIPKVVSDIPSK